jgi:cephalosporin hydroxylase
VPWFCDRSVSAPAVDRLARLSELVDYPINLSLREWVRLHERALQSGADLLLEVGRGYGNSTVVLTEAAHRVGATVVSVGFDEPPTFETVTWPKLEPVVGAAWRAPLTVVQSDISDFTPAPCSRCFVFWDAHGHEVADTMLNRLVPSLPAGSMVVVHDVCTPEDYAALTPEQLAYAPPLAEYGQWRGLISPYEELELIGPWIDHRRLEWEQDTFMLAFTV